MIFILFFAFTVPFILAIATCFLIGRTALTGHLRLMALALGTAVWLAPFGAIGGGHGALAIPLGTYLAMPLLGPDFTAPDEIARIITDLWLYTLFTALLSLLFAGVYRFFFPEWSLRLPHNEVSTG